MLSVKIEHRRTGDHQIFEVTDFHRVGPGSDAPYGPGVHLLFASGNGAHYPVSSDPANPDHDVYVMNSNGKTVAHYEL